MLSELMLSNRTHSMVRVACFNASLEAGRLAGEKSQLNGDELSMALATPEHPLLKNTAAIIQAVRPDILLINEFDFAADYHTRIADFQRHYLSVSQCNKPPIEYPFSFAAPVNSGLATGFNVAADKNSRLANTYGHGAFAGHYGMLLLSRFPVIDGQVRTFQKFLWRDMPGNLLHSARLPDGSAFYSDDAQQRLRLSSKSHWDIPLDINGETLHVLASHPTPPVFGGTERRNRARNHDEIRFWLDYLEPGYSHYHYDDCGQAGGFEGKRFVLLGDLNSSPDEGDSDKYAITRLLAHSAVNSELLPVSDGGLQHSPNNPYAKSHTAIWRMRADYVLPSKCGIIPYQAGVFWPSPGQVDSELFADEQAVSDHRLVWMDIELTRS